MELAYGILASAAEFTPEGKVYVLGGDFDIIHTDTVPVRQPAMAVVVKLLVQPTECEREHQLRVDFIDQDGAKVHPEISLPFTPHVRPGYPQRAVGVGLVLNYQGLELSREGGYAFHIMVDGLEMGSIPLYVERKVA